MYVYCVMYDNIYSAQIFIILFNLNLKHIENIYTIQYNIKEIYVSILKSLFTRFNQLLLWVIELK